MWRRRHYDCTNCKDTGMDPGGRNRNLIVLPMPCRHCPKGQALEVKRVAAAEATMPGGTTPPPLELTPLQIAVEALRRISNMGGTEECEIAREAIARLQAES